MNTPTIIKFALGLGLFALLLLFLAKYSVLALTIAGGFAFYFIIDQMLDALERMGLNQGAGYLVLFLILAIAIVGGILHVSLPLFEQVQGLAERLPELSDGREISQLKQDYPFLEGGIERIKSSMADFLNTLLSASGAILTALITIPIITVTLLASRNELQQTFAALVPNNYFEVTMTIAHDITAHIRDFIWARALETLGMIVIYGIGFWFIDMPSWLLLSIIGGLLNIIPYIGPLLTVVPVILFSLLAPDGGLILSGIIVLVIGQLVDNAVLQTWLVAKYVDMHPLLAVLVTLVGGELLGMLGLVAAIPIFVISKHIIIGFYQALKAIERRQSYLEQELTTEKHG